MGRMIIFKKYTKDELRLRTNNEMKLKVKTKYNNKQLSFNIKLVHGCVSFGT